MGFPVAMLNTEPIATAGYDLEKTPTWKMKPIEVVEISTRRR